MGTAIVIAIIALYAAYVVYKKIKDMKAGKFCSCSCDGCSGNKCKKNQL